MLTSKKKTTALLGRGAEILLAAELPDGDWENILGKAPPIYSREINYWLMRAAIHVLRTRPEIGCIYVHTTDYPMHEWPLEAPNPLTLGANRRASERGRRGGAGCRVPR